VFYWGPGRSLTVKTMHVSLDFSLIKKTSEWVLVALESEDNIVLVLARKVVASNFLTFTRTKSSALQAPYITVVYQAEQKTLGFPREPTGFFIS
jgi:hypothetical protein